MDMGSTDSASSIPPTGEMDGHHRELVREAASRQGIAVSDAQVDALLRHLLLVIEKNKVINLTAIDDVEEGIEKHIEDSLVGLKEIGEAKAGRFCDLGTGAGYPGIVIGIMTDRKGTLVDSVKKKVRCVDEFIATLGLSRQLTTCDMRAEQISARKPGSCAVVTARALSSLASILELAAPLLSYGGRLIVWKGSPEQAETDAAAKVSRIVGLEPRGVREAAIGLDGAARHIYVYEKTCAPKVKLPRTDGMAQHHPLA